MLRTFSFTAQPREAHPDEALVAAAQAEPAAFEALYARYFPRVYRYLAARAETTEDAADLAQAVFERAFVAIGRYRPGKTPFASWLFRIARNAAIDAHRQRRPSVPWELLPAFEPAAGESPEHGALRTERVRELRRAIATLNNEKRDLLALRYAGGLTVPEIAPLVGKNPEAVKKQLQRTLQQIKEHYRDDE